MTTKTKTRASRHKRPHASTPPVPPALPRSAAISAEHPPVLIPSHALFAMLERLEAEISRRRQQELEAITTVRQLLVTDSGMSTVRKALGEIGLYEPPAAGQHRMPFIATPTIADASERILVALPQDTTGLHVRALADRLQVEYGIQTTPKNLINTLGRWIQRKRRFRKVGPNTFAAAVVEGGDGGDLSRTA